LDAQPPGTQYRLNYSVVDSKVVQNKVIDPSKTPRLQVREEHKMTGSIKDIVRVRRHLINLIIMIAVWIASSFDYYLLNFQLKSIQGNIFLNTFSSAISELPAVIISGFMYKKLGIKITLVTWFSVSLLGGICLLILGKSN
jgi:Na+/melibiose symporter-like transporter